MLLRRSHAAPDRSFNLVRWFSLSGSIMIVLISVITSLVLSTFMEEHLLRRDAVVMRDFVERIAQHHDPAGYFSQAYAPDGTALNDFFYDIAHMPDVARINAFAIDGTVVWSSDPAMIGKQFPANEELEEALTGELVFEKGNLAKTAKAEHLPFGADIDWVVENYIPISDSSRDEIVGVLEIYRIPVALAESINSGRQLVWFTIAGGGTLLFFSLFGAVQRGQRLIRSQQATLVGQARLATIGEMASSVAHSIRNPIASIRSSAELALDGLQQPEIAESLEDIVNEVDRFDGWIRELLTFTSKAGDPEAICDPAEAAASSLAAFSDRAERQGVTIENRMPRDLPAVRGESALLVQVLNSLIANALDAMPQGGQLFIDAGTGNGHVRLSLSDTGFGIPPDRLDGLFDPLVTHKNGGLGIGLALAKQVVERYGGSIWIDSAIGSGTTVTLELPVGEVQ